MTNVPIDMNRLQFELHRLYLPPSDEPGQARAMVMELRGPGDWNELSKVWRGVQAELGLPAPAIAVSGSDGMQLWFSIQVPVSRERAEAFLSRLCTRYLPGTAMGRLRLWPAAAEAAISVPLIPQQSESTGNWSAFVAPDLAPIFSDEPSLDIEPGLEGQADLLARLQSIAPADFEAAMLRLAPARATEASQAGPPSAPVDGKSNLDPRRFLQQVLNDETMELALRIEAAKALLRSS